MPWPVQTQYVPGKSIMECGSIMCAADSESFL